MVETHCTCRRGTCGQCKHAAAVVAYVNKEDTSTKTSITNMWKRPSAKQLGIYNKGVPFSEMYAPKLPDGKLRRQPVLASIVDSNCPLGIMLRQEAQVKENLASLDKLLPQLGPEVMVSQDECKDIAKYTMLHRERAVRISASSKAHRIKIRTADFETLAKDLATPQSFKGAACSYGIEKEPEARRGYESEKHKVIQVFLKSYMQEFPCFVPSKKGEKFGLFHTCMCDVSVSHGGKADIKLHIASRKHQGYVRAADNQSNLAICGKAYQEEVLKVLLELRFDVGQLKTQMAAILTGQDQIRARLAVMEQAERESDAPPSPPLFILPLTTMEDFEAAQSRLRNAANQAMLVSKNSLTIPGFPAIIREQVTANVVPVEQAIGDYLAGANDREGGRAERMAKKLHALAIQ
ncbi:hypothetical protein HPB47_016871 [Ixodes persulcatus]|uniref:Uncharacterized protein n=1 Tax=Ixodes persulcatus TaxID=34615 RepID=A0AC60QPS8_IXOPE|nr:hypothetical protein HPB47_016871 [Ixodes persulcatus]